MSAKYKDGWSLYVECYRDLFNRDPAPASDSGVSVEALDEMMTCIYTDAMAICTFDSQFEEMKRDAARYRFFRDTFARQMQDMAIKRMALEEMKIVVEPGDASVDFDTTIDEAMAAHGPSVT